MSLRLDPVLHDLVMLRILALLTILALGMTTGAAIGMYSFSTPVIRVNKAHPSLIITRQFNELVSRGFRYLQPAGRIEAIGLLALSLLFACHPDPTLTWRWRFFAAALLVSVQAIWYEVYFIFPINDRMKEIMDLLEEEQPGKGEVSEADDKLRPEVLRLLEQWRMRHVPRIVCPGVAMLLALYGIAI